MKEAGQPLNAGKIAELSGLDRKEQRPNWFGLCLARRRKTKVNVLVLLPS